MVIDYFQKRFVMNKQLWQCFFQSQAFPIGKSQILSGSAPGARCISRLSEFRVSLQNLRCYFDTQKRPKKHCARPWTSELLDLNKNNPYWDVDRLSAAWVKQVCKDVSVSRKKYLPTFTSEFLQLQQRISFLPSAAIFLWFRQYNSCPEKLKISRHYFG